MKSKVLISAITLLAVVWFTINPPRSGYSEPKNTNTVRFDSVMATEKIQRSLDALESKKEKLESLTKQLKEKPKVIIRYKVKRIKPKTITLYVRQPDGSITEHKVKSDGGFYIVELDSLAKENTHIEFKTDTQTKKNFLQKLFNRKP